MLPYTPAAASPEAAAGADCVRLAAQVRRLQWLNEGADRRTVEAERQTKIALRREAAARQRARASSARLRSRSEELRAGRAHTAAECADLRGRIAEAADRCRRLGELKEQLQQLRGDELDAALTAAAARRAAERRERLARERALQEHLRRCSRDREALEEVALSQLEALSAAAAADWAALMRREEFERVAEQNRAAQVAVAAERRAREEARRQFRAAAAQRRGTFVNALLVTAVGREHLLPRAVSLWAAARAAHWPLGPATVHAAVAARQGALRRRAAEPRELRRARCRRALAALPPASRPTAWATSLCLLSSAAAAAPDPSALWRELGDRLAEEQRQAEAARTARRRGAAPAEGAGAVRAGAVDPAGLCATFLATAPAARRRVTALLGALGDCTGEEWELAAEAEVDAEGLTRAAGAVAELRAEEMAYDFGEVCADSPATDLFRPCTPPQPAPGGLRAGAAGWRGLRELWAAARRSCEPPPSRERPVLGGLAWVLLGAEGRERAARDAAREALCAHRQCTGRAVPDAPPAWLLARRAADGAVCVAVAAEAGGGLEEQWRGGDFAGAAVQVPRSSRPFPPEVRAHARFLRGALGAFPAVHGALQALRRRVGAPLRVSFTGHGGGAAVATLLCAFYCHLRLSELKVDTLVTFGCPKLWSIDRYDPVGPFAPLAGVQQLHYATERDPAPALLGSVLLRESAELLQRLGLPYSEELRPASTAGELRQYRCVLPSLHVLPLPQIAPAAPEEAHLLWGGRHRVTHPLQLKAAEAARRCEFHRERLLPRAVAEHSLGVYLERMHAALTGCTGVEHPLELQEYPFAISCPAGACGVRSFLPAAEEAAALRGDIAFLPTPGGAARSVLRAELRRAEQDAAPQYTLLGLAVGALSSATHPKCWRALGRWPLTERLERAACRLAAAKVAQRAARCRAECADWHEELAAEEARETLTARAADEVREESVVDAMQERGQKLEHLNLVLLAARPDVARWRTLCPPGGAAEWTAGRRAAGWGALLRISHVAQHAAPCPVTAELQPHPVRRLDSLFHCWEELQADAGGLAAVARAAPATVTLWGACAADQSAMLHSRLTEAAALVREGYRERRRHRAATRIQCLRRRMAAATAAADRRRARAAAAAAAVTAEREWHLNRAAAIVTGAMRRHSTRERGARTVQRAWRGCRGRRRAAAVRRLHAAVHIVEDLAEAAAWSAARGAAVRAMQRAARGWLARGRVDAARTLVRAAEVGWDAEEAAAYARAHTAAGAIARCARRRKRPTPERQRLLELRAERRELAQLCELEKRLLQRQWLVCCPLPPAAARGPAPRRPTVEWRDAATGGPAAGEPDTAAEGAGGAGLEAAAAELEHRLLRREEGAARRELQLGEGHMRRSLGDCCRASQREQSALWRWRRALLMDLRLEEAAAVARGREEHRRRLGQVRAATARVRGERGGQLAAAKGDWFAWENEVRGQFSDRAVKLLHTRRHEAPGCVMALLLDGAAVRACLDPPICSALCALCAAREAAESAQLEAWGELLRAAEAGAAQARKDEEAAAAAGKVATWAALIDAPPPGRAAAGGGAAAVRAAIRRPKSALISVATVFVDEPPRRRHRGAQSALGSASWGTSASRGSSAPPSPAGGGAPVAQDEAAGGEQLPLHLDMTVARMRGEVHPSVAVPDGVRPVVVPPQTLDLRGGGVSEQAAAAVLGAARRSGRIRSLAIAGPQAGATAVRAVVELLQGAAGEGGLHTLLLQEAAAGPVETGALLAAAVACRTLLALDLSGCVGVASSAKGAAALRGLGDDDCSIAVLSLDDCMVGNYGAGLLQGFVLRPSAKCLSLERNGVGDEGARVLLRALQCRQGPFRARMQGNAAAGVLLGEIAARAHQLALNRPPPVFPRAASAGRRGASTRIQPVEEL